MWLHHLRAREQLSSELIANHRAKIIGPRALAYEKFPIRCTFHAFNDDQNHTPIIVIPSFSDWALGWGFGALPRALAGALRSLGSE